MKERGSWVLRYLIPVVMVLLIGFAIKVFLETSGVTRRYYHKHHAIQRHR